MINRIFFFIILTIGLPLTAQVNKQLPSVLVQNYTVNDYNASCQNWGIAISYWGTLFVANDEGLLTFDGNTWQLYQLPDKSPLYDITFQNDTVYTGGESGCGFWLEDGFGNMVYERLSAQPSHVDFSYPKTNYQVPITISEAKPTAFATAGNLNFTGTETNGLYITDDDENVLLHLNLQNQFPDNYVRAICVQDVNLIWVALDNGLCQIDIDPPLLQLGKRSELGKLEAVAVSDGYIVIRTNTGYFSRILNSSGQPFSEIQEYSDLLSLFSAQRDDKKLDIEAIFTEKSSLGEFAVADNIYEAPDDMYWLTSENKAALFQLEEGKANLKCRILFDNYNLNLVTRDKQFFTLNDSLYLVSMVQGTYLINTRRLIGEGLGSFTPPRFSRLEYSDKEGKHNLLPATEKMSLPHDFRELVVHVGTTVFTPVHQISYKIDGVSSDWSSWQKEGQISFLQLPEGKYTMHIRKYVVRGPFPEITLQIEVRPAWYNSVWAYIVYIILFVLIIQESIRYQLRKMRREEQEKLEEQQRQEEQRMQQLKNEMLETELQNKNNELTLQTSALVKRNQAIRELIEELERQKESLGDRYPNKLYNKLRSLMENAMSDQSDWKLFESYFNSAHQNFVERLRQQYDDLTPGDLRVCCLLRMNLSTKEIASLMNVSIRAVELRRYRLRKRLALEGDTNLVDFLIEY